MPISFETYVKKSVKNLPLRYVDVCQNAFFKKVHLQKLMILFFSYVLFIFIAFVLFLFLICAQMRKNITTVPVSELIGVLYTNTTLLMVASLLSLVVFIAMLVKIVRVQNKSVQVIGGLLNKVEHTALGYHMYFTFDQPDIEQTYCKVSVPKTLAKNPQYKERYNIVLFGDNSVGVFPIEELMPPSEKKSKKKSEKKSIFAKKDKYY